MANKWLQHLNNFRRTNRHVDAKDMMREARKTYRGGGASSASGVNSASGANSASGSSSVAPYTQNNLASTASSLQGGRRRSRKRSSKSRRTRRR